MNQEPAAKALVDVAVLDDDPDFRTYIEDFLVDEGRYSVRAFDHRILIPSKTSRLR